MDNKIYIVIVTYNGMSYMKKCLDSCTKHRIIVVDNNSTDGTTLFIENNYPQIKLFKQKTNLGFGQANNLGIKYALNEGANFVFLLNQDACIEVNTIKKLIITYQQHSDYGILSPMHYNGKGDALDENFSHYLNYNRNKKFYFDAINKKLNEVYQIPFVNAAAWLLPRKTLETIGGFDPIFYHYAEDDNYCQRVLYHGFKIGVVTNCHIYHDRENRKAQHSSTLKEKLVLEERLLKVKWANLNISVDVELIKTQRELRKLIFKLCLKLKLKSLKYCYLKLKLLKKIIVEIEKSRKTNIVKGNHYL